MLDDINDETTEWYYPASELSETENAEKLKQEILNGLIRGIGKTMRTTRNPALVWAILEGVFLDRKSVRAVARESGEAQKTAHNIFRKLSNTIG